MATNKKARTNRQKTTKSLPVSRSKKKAPVAKSIKSSTRRETAKKPAPARKKSTYSKIPAINVKQYKLKVWTDTYIIIQLQRPKKPAAKKTKPKAEEKSKLITILQKNIPLILIAIGLLGTLYFATDIFRPAAPLTVYSPPVPAEIERSKPTTLAPKTLPKSDPIQLKIPDIAIDINLITVGKNPDNTLEVPKDAQVPAWYRLSPTPGELGPSIIVGHVDSPRGPAIFWKLNQLKTDQIIEVTRSDNSSARFRVTEVKQFEQNAFPTEEVYGTIRHAGLRLITCGGVFNRTTQSYSHNTVVFAELIP